MAARARLGLVGALLLASCAHVPAPTPPGPRWPTFAQALPPRSVSTHPFDARALEGQAVLVVFIATWCFPCLTEFVALERLEREYASRGLAIVLVGMDLEGEQVLAPFAETMALRWPLLIADDALRAGQSPFGLVRELPARVLFDRQGQVLTSYTGVLEYPKLAAVVELALRSGPGAPR